jgi:GTP-binding protein EngB required for normal cell division
MSNSTISKEHREKKAHLVKKYLKRLKKPEGLVRLVDGRADYEGKLNVSYLYHAL